jgi:hypothetical protein
MAYKPRLRFIFNFGRWYDTDRTLPLLRYLNAAGVAPAVLAGEPDILDRFKDNGIAVKALAGLPDEYDVMLSPGVGYIPFERYWLEKSMEAGKINVQSFYPPVINGSSNLNNTPRRTRFTHAVCTGCQRTLDDLRNINKEVVYLLTGMPSWDRFSTAGFKADVAQVRRRYGDKLLVIGVSCFLIEEETAWYRRMIRQAESLGFRVVLQVHIGREKELCETLRPYVNPGIDRYCLFAAASHVIVLIQSLMAPECLYLNRPVAAKPLAHHYHGWNRHAWVDDPAEWRRWATPLYGEDCVSIMPLVHDEPSLSRFLSDPRPAPAERVDRMFGLPTVRSFTEHAFQMLDTYFGPENRCNVEMMRKKGEVSRGAVVDYSFWDIRADWNQFRGVHDPDGFLSAGMHLIREDKPADALRYLERADMYSGTDTFAFIQHLKSACCLALGRLEEADTHIYRSLFVQPHCRDFQHMKGRIAAAADASGSAPAAGRVPEAVR